MTYLCVCVFVCVVRSYIKKFRNNPSTVLPDRAHVGMTVPFMANYVRLLIATCHRRGVHAMGGMAALIPVPGDAAKNKDVFDKVRADKLREVKAGCDGTWVAHPGLIQVATEIFNQYMPTPNQISKPIETVKLSAKDLISLSGVPGSVSVAGVHSNLDVALDYVEAWVRGNGCVPLHNLMEDAATAEIARCQVWQWMKHGVKLAEGQTVTRAFVEEQLNTIVASKVKAAGNGRKYDLATDLLRQLLFAPTLPEFLTSLAYPFIVTTQPKAKL